MNILRKNQPVIGSLTILLVILLGCIPTQLVPSLSQKETLQDGKAGVNTLRGAKVEVPRLMGITNRFSNPGSDSAPNSTKISLDNCTVPTFAIGAQEGQGGGNVAIRDSFNLTSTELLNTTNEIGSDKLPTTRNDSISILTPSNFARNDLQFNLSSIEAQPDWRLREDYMGLRTPWKSYLDDYKSVAMAFTVEEDYVNLSRVRINLGVEGSPSGLIYIVNSTSNQPDNSKKLSNTQSLLDRSSWREYSFTVTSPLKKGITYFVVMNSTSDGEFDYWEWRKNNNFDYGVDTGAVYAVIAPEYSTWYNQGPFDLPLQIQVQPVEKQGLSWVAKTYSSPDEVKIWYNTTLGERLLTRFNGFDANNTEIHNFKSNISLTFNLDFHANYTYSGNPISGKTSYKAQNDSIVNWNITFSTAKITTSYLIRNHTIVIRGIPSDWNGTKIYLNDSSTPEYPDLTNDPRVTWDGDPTHKYTHGNTTMVVNASTLTVNTTWHVCLEAPNYLLSFNLSRGGTDLLFSYEANVTDILDLDFEVPEIGGNISYWIEYYGSDIQKNLNFDSSNSLITDSWDITDSVSQTTNVNGTYDLQGFWKNSDETKVGTFTRKVDMFINTSLTVHPEVEVEVIIGEILKVRVNFTSIHNDSLIRNAKIWCNSSWDSAPNETLAQFANNTYGASLATTGMTAGETGTVIITTQMPWFVNWTNTINVYFVQNSSLVVNVTNLSLEWRANETLRIEYNITGGNGIPSATITVDGDSQNTISISDVYYYRLNSTNPKYGGADTSHLNLNITASHTNYLTKIWFFDLTITLGETNITATIGGDGAVYNDTLGTQIYYADSSADHVSILLRYYHNITDDDLSTLATIDITRIPIIPILDQEEGPSSTWNITFDPDQVNQYVIEITFSLTNYENATFIFHLEVLNAKTRLQTEYQNNTNVYYAESNDFSLFFNNTDWNENITFSGEGPIGINDTSKIQFLNLTGDLYWFRFAYNPLYVGVSAHSVEITYTLTNFESSSLNVIFNVLKSPFVDLDGVDAVDGIPRNNGTAYIKHFSPNEFDEFSISLSYYANKTSQILISTPSVSSDLTIWDIQVDQANHNWTFIFNGSAIGTFLINISFSHENYSSLTFTIQYIIQPADSSITDYSPRIIGSPINATIDSGDSIDFWLVWQSEYNEDLNDSDGVVINDSSVVFVSSDPSNGTHYFHYTASDVKDYTISLIFGTLNYTAIEIILCFQVTNRSLEINDILSTHENGWISPVGYLQYGDIYYFHIIINDSQTNIGVNINIFSWLPTNVSFVNVTSGDHLFAYHSTIIATTTSVLISIPFKLSNYVDVSYDIRFYVKVAESRLVSVPSTITTYYTQGTNFSLIWESESNLNAPFSPVLSINSSRIISSAPCFFDNVTNGNYSFVVLANQAGTYIVNLNFWASVFENQSIDVTIIILPLPTKFSFISLTNNTIIGQTSPFYFSDLFNITLTWFETINFVGVRDLSPDYSGNGSTMLSLSISYTNGTHKFIIEANTLGFYQVIVVLGIPNYADLTYSVFINISVMPTLALDISSFTYNQTIIVEEMFTVSGNESYQTIRESFVPNTFALIVRMNGTSVGFNVERDDNWFKITFSTAGNPYGNYNLAIQVSLTGYQSQIISFNITLLGRETTLRVTLPGKSFEQGEPIEITALLNYTHTTNGGSGAGILLTPLNGTEISFYIGLKYSNGSTRNLPIYTTNTTLLGDVIGQATYIIDGKYTQDAIGFSKINVEVGPSLSGLPFSYSMPATELAEYEIIYIFDPLEIIIPVIIVGVVVLLIVGAVAASGITLNRKRKRRSATIHAKQRKVEQSFEDVKSIRLLIARHESGLQFYSEKTIADVKTDTDALSGMSTALSSFMKELSDGMSSSTEERERDKIEVMSREGLHMIVWHGEVSSFIIISELRLPDYFQDRLKKLGQEVEKKFAQDLKDFYSADQIPSNQVKKLVRKHIPLHYFSAFILNEGVLTLESIKLSGAEKKMLKLMKEIRFQKEGIHFFFSEQIISHLSKHFNRSKTIKFLDLAIEINLLVEATQEEILNITRNINQ